MKVFRNKYIVVIYGIFTFGAGLFGLGVSSFVDYVLSRYNENQVEEYDYCVDILFYITSCFTFISVFLMGFESEDSVLLWKWK